MSERGLLAAGGVVQVVCEVAAEIPDSRGQLRDRHALRPSLEQLEQACLVVRSERHRSRRAGPLECRDDATRVFSCAGLVEEFLARIPRDRKGLGTRGELHEDAVETFRHHLERTA